MKKQFLALTTCLAVLTSCEKDEKEVVTTSPKTKSEIVMNRAWDIDYLYTRTLVADTLAYEDTDTINGIAEFKANKVLESLIPGMPLETSTWEIIGDSIYLDGLGMYIEKLNDKEFVFSREDSDVVPDSIQAPYNVLMRFSLSR